MAKITAVIDIGSNSLTLVIYKKTSRLAFYELHRQKHKIKIGEGSYEKNGFLQEKPMQRAYEALKEFSFIIKAFKAKKTLCIATSALRDAPNKKEFIKKVYKNLGIKIKVIDGDKESFLGAIAAINLLPKYKEFVTIDIGGGSTELAKVINGKIVKTLSLQLGHVRVNEKCKTMEEKKSFIDSELLKLDHDFLTSTIVTIGGTAREIAKYIQRKIDYPLYKNLHAYSYTTRLANKYIKELIEYDKNRLKKYISKNRRDTILDGALILYKLINKLVPNDIVVSSKGVREGVYLSDLLRNFNLNFPVNFQLDQRVLLDRFSEVLKVHNYYQNIANKLQKVICNHDKYKDIISFCSKLLLLNSMSFYSWIEYLNFGFTHQQKVTIAYLMQSFIDEEMDLKLYKKYQILLPSFEELEKLFFILNLTSMLAKDMNIQKIHIDKTDNILYIDIDLSELTKQEIEDLDLPYKIIIRKK